MFAESVSSCSQDCTQAWSGHHRLDSDTPVLKAKCLRVSFPWYRPFGVRIRPQRFSRSRWTAMLAVFSGRQLAQGYCVTCSPFTCEAFLCLFRVIGNDLRAPSLIDLQIPNFQNGYSPPPPPFISGLRLVVKFTAKFCRI